MQASQGPCEMGMQPDEASQAWFSLLFLFLISYLCFFGFSMQSVTLKWSLAGPGTPICMMILGRVYYELVLFLFCFIDEGKFTYPVQILCVFLREGLM